MDKKDEVVKFKVLLIGPSGTSSKIKELVRPLSFKNTSITNSHMTTRSPPEFSISLKMSKLMRRIQSNCKSGIQYLRHNLDGTISFQINCQITLQGSCCSFVFLCNR